MVDSVEDAEGGRDEDQPTARAAYARALESLVPLQKAGGLSSYKAIADRSKQMEARGELNGCRSVTHTTARTVLTDREKVQWPSVETVLRVLGADIETFLELWIQAHADSWIRTWVERSRNEQAQRLADVSQERDRLVVAVEKVRSDLADERRLAGSRRVEIDSLKRKVENLELAEARLRETKQDSDKEAARDKKLIESLRLEIVKTDEAAAAARVASAKIQSDLDQARRISGSRRVEIESLKKKVDSLQTTLNATRTTVETLESKVRDRDSTIETQRRKIQGLEFNAQWGAGQQGPPGSPPGEAAFGKTRTSSTPNTYGKVFAATLPWVALEVALIIVAVVSQNPVRQYADTFVMSYALLLLLAAAVSARATWEFMKKKSASTIFWKLMLYALPLFLVASFGVALILTAGDSASTHR